MRLKAWLCVAMLALVGGVTVCLSLRGGNEATRLTLAEKAAYKASLDEFEKENGSFDPFAPFGVPLTNCAALGLDEKKIREDNHRLIKHSEGDHLMIVRPPETRLVDRGYCISLLNAEMQSGWVAELIFNRDFGNISFRTPCPLFPPSNKG